MNLDGDGRPGLVAVNSEGLVVGLPWTGPGPLDLGLARSVDPEGVVTGLAVVDGPVGAAEAVVVVLADGQAIRLHFDDAGAWVATPLGDLVQRGGALVAADVDLDGQRDLLAVDRGADGLRLARGVDGGFTVAGGRPRVADIDGNGQPDVAVAAGALGGAFDAAEVWLQDRADIALPDGTSLLPLLPLQGAGDAGHDSHDLALVDLDGDGWLELVAVGADGAIDL